MRVSTVAPRHGTQARLQNRSLSDNPGPTTVNPGWPADKSGFHDGAMWLQRDEITAGRDGAKSCRAVPRFLESIDRFVGALGPALRRRLSATELMDVAVRRTGLTDFGDRSFEEPLHILTSSYEEEANLSAFGRLAARWDALRFLCNLLILRRVEQNVPEILGQSIEQPIFVTGLPRSATTFLHNLLALDGANQTVRCWETIYPYATCGNPSASLEACAAKVDRQLNAFAWFAPDVRRVHPMSARSPQECTEITGHVFRSLRFDTTHHVPTYRRWLDEAGHVAAYRFHRRFLQHLQRRNGAGRWILKSPDHVFALDAIREIYPDARFVFMHRDPLDVLPSVAELTEILRRPFARKADRLEIGRQISDRWAHGADTLVAEAAKFRDSPRVAHLQFRAFVQHPARSVAMLYERFGLKFDEAFAARLRSFVAAWPNGGYRRDKVQLEEYGLRIEAERNRYRDYTACFGL